MTKSRFDNSNIDDQLSNTIPIKSNKYNRFNLRSRTKHRKTTVKTNTANISSTNNTITNLNDNEYINNNVPDLKDSNELKDKELKTTVKKEKDNKKKSKSSMLRISKLVGKPLQAMKETLTQSLSTSTIQTASKYSKKRRKLPYGLRYNVWKKYNGEVFNAKCYVDFCDQVINPFTFEVGHDIPASKGGSDSITNLRPICRNCNNSMSNVYTIAEYSALFK